MERGKEGKTTKLGFEKQSTWLDCVKREDLLAVASVLSQPTLPTAAGLQKAAPGSPLRMGKS